MKRVSVMIVDDSAVSRGLLASVLGADPRLRIAGAVDSAEKALRVLPRLAPDVISMDIRLPGMDGIEATRRIMRDWPTPIVVVAADCRSETIGNSMEALRAGALAVVEKPTSETADGYSAISRRLCDQFVNMSQLKVLRRRFDDFATRGPKELTGRSLLPSDWSTHTSPAHEGPFDLVAMVASTGGPAAIAGVLRSLDRGFAPPILIVQHMAGNFLAGYTEWLDGTCPQRVTLARHLEQPLSGNVYIAPGGCHMTYSAGRLRMIADDAGQGHIPSGDVLFRSLARSVGPRALGVLMTGMGDDGAAGLLEMRQAGAHTIVQDRATSAVYGMPAAACALGAACEQIALDAMAQRLGKLVCAGGSGIEP